MRVSSPRSMIQKFAAVSVFSLASLSMASGFDRPLIPKASATCNCKNAADCTCPKGQCKCKNCGAHAAPHASPNGRMTDTLRGATESTRLPQSARRDARGGLSI